MSMQPLVQIPVAFKVSQAQFEALARANSDVAMERSATGELQVIPPTGGTTGKRNAGIIAALWNWNQVSALGEVFDSSAVFHLPNGADRSPDAAWVALARWQALTPEEQDGFPPLCPDFVVELRSQSDRLKDLRAKMAEYRANGCRLGWLIDPQNRQVEIYRQEQPVEVITAPLMLAGEAVLPGFTFKCDRVFG